MHSRLFFSCLLLCSIVFSFIFLPSALSIGLIGSVANPMVYEPGKEITVDYTITDTNSKVDVQLKGDAVEYATISPVVDYHFTLTIHFPDTLPPTGVHTFILSAQEIPGGGGGISSVVGVNKIFQIIVYSHEKAIIASLSATNINVGGIVPFLFDVASHSYKDINEVRGEITIYNNSVSNETDNAAHLVGRVTTATLPLPALTEIELPVKFNASTLPSGDYRAAGVVYYDGQSITANARFKIGTKDILLDNYSRQLEQGFSTFRADVVNNWGNDLERVYATLYLNGTEILQTPTVSIPAWQETSLQAIGRFDYPPGEYAGKLNIYFDQEMKVFPLKINIVLPAVKEQAPSTGMSETLLWVIVGGAFLILITIIIGIIIIRKRKED